MSVPAPEHFSEAERVIWTDTLARLGNVEVASSQAALLEGYVTERARWEAAEQFIRANGDVLILRNERGEVTASKAAPQLQIARSARAAALALAAELGLASDGETDGAPIGGRDHLGRFLPGNLAAISHGLRTDRLPVEYQHLQDEVSAFVEASLTDDGGESEVATRRKSLHGYRARVHRRIVQLDAAIEVRGLFDRRGKLRVQWLMQLTGLIATARALDGTLGLERRARRVPSLAEVMDGDE